MAYYKYENYLSKYDHEMFETIHKPGEAATYPGIYRCEGCGKEITHTLGSILPPQNHHQHSLAQGAIRWRLIVWAAT